MGAQEIFVITGQNGGFPVASDGEVACFLSCNAAEKLCGYRERVVRYVPEQPLRAALATASAKLHGAAQALRLLVTDDAPPALRAVVQCLDDAHASAEMALGDG